jgi:hypothetical protein
MCSAARPKRGFSWPVKNCRQMNRQQGTKCVACHFGPPLAQTSRSGARRYCLCVDVRVSTVQSANGQLGHLGFGKLHCACPVQPSFCWFVPICIRARRCSAGCVQGEHQQLSLSANCCFTLHWMDLALEGPVAFQALPKLPTRYIGLLLGLSICTALVFVSNYHLDPLLHLQAVR